MLLCFTSRLPRLFFFFMAIHISEQFQHLNILGSRGWHTLITNNENSSSRWVVDYSYTYYTSSARKLAQEENNSRPPPSRKKSTKIVINPNLVGVGTISSDGLLTDQKERQEEAKLSRDAVKSNLGISSKNKKQTSNKSNQKLSKKAQQLRDQRTANGTVDGNLQAGLALPEDQEIQVQEIKRGSKQVTIVR